MAETVASAVVQENVSGLFSYLSSNRTEKASKRHNMERLEMAHSELDLALERTRSCPSQISPCSVRGRSTSAPMTSVVMCCTDASS
uniref:Uncharacterized protein n=1 Tax=Oryza punctata TaxID=4537 RepID=A0A0E0LJD9_ORYPU